MVPILFRLGQFNIYAYGFFIALAFIAGLLLSTLQAKKEGIPFERVIDLFFLTVLSAILGARILFVLINLDLYRKAPLEIFKIWEGGLVFYGGFLLAITVALTYMKWHRLPIWKFSDLFTPSIALGLFLTRIGCFLAGCCYGKETTLPWGVRFTDPNSLAPLNITLHPTQLYDSANGLFLFLFLNWVDRRKKFEGELFWLFILLYSISRFLIEILRGDPRGFLFGELISTSQGIGIFLAILSLFMLFYLRKGFKEKEDGDIRDP
jgi:phosphatidylglycerol:prolipoprotein diacylglycerol transferase